MSKKNYWFMRLGKIGEPLYRDLAINDSVVAIGFGTDRDLRDKKIYDDVRAYIHSVGRSAVDIAPINNFLNEMQLGDLILLQIRPRGGHRNYIYGVAKITSAYEPLKYLLNRNLAKNEEWRPARRIEWLVKNKNVSDFGEYILDYWYRRQGTALPIKKGQSEHDALIERIDAML